MFRFFRHIRRKLLSDGKLLRYLAYALGEIVLIVIGILIALNINNWNEARKNQELVYEYLTQIHHDLEQSMWVCNWATVTFMQKDAAIYDVLNNRVVAEDYQNPDTRQYYAGVVTSTIQPSFGDMGFRNLESVINSVPEQLQPLVDRIERLYVHWMESVYSNGKAVDDISKEFLHWRTNNANWQGTQYFQNLETPLPPELVEFHLTDPYYKRLVYETYVAAFLNHYRYIIIVRNDAVQIYEELSELLGIEEAEGLICNIVPEEFSRLTGRYRVTSSTRKVGYKHATLNLEGDNLSFSTDEPGSDPQRLFPLFDPNFGNLLPLEKPSFTDEDGNFYTVELTEEDTVEGLDSRFGNEIIRFERVD